MILWHFNRHFKRINGGLNGGLNGTLNDTVNDEIVIKNLINNNIKHYSTNQGGPKTEPKEVENVGSLSEECRKSDGSLAKMQLTDRQDLILKMIKNNPYVSAKAMSEVLSVTRRTVERDIALLQKNGIIRHRGNTSSGHWEVII